MGAGIVTLSVTTPCKKAGLLFLFPDYYLEGEAVVNAVTVMIRARLSGKYPLSLAKTLSGCGINNLQTRLETPSGITPGHVQPIHSQFRSPRSPLS